MKSVLVLLASLLSANAHVMATYKGSLLPIRTGGRTTGDGQSTTAGPCGSVNNAAVAFGANGVSKVQTGQYITVNLRYSATHQPPTGTTSGFYVTMQCSSDKKDLNSDLHLRQNDGEDPVLIGKTEVNWRSQSPVGFSFPFPSTTPSGHFIKDGDYCTVAVTDQRNWGNCYDFQAEVATGSVVAGLATPAILAAVAVPVFLYRPAVAAMVQKKTAGSNPLFWRQWNAIIGGVVALFTVVSCFAPNWSEAPDASVGPWISCSSYAYQFDTGCNDSAASGHPAIHFTRAFVLTGFMAAFFTFAAPMAVKYGKMTEEKAKKYQPAAFTWLMVAEFCAIMIWANVLGTGRTLGFSFYLAVLALFIGGGGLAASLYWANQSGSSADGNNSNWTGKSADASPSSPVSSGGWAGKSADAPASPSVVAAPAAKAVAPPPARSGPPPRAAPAASTETSAASTSGAKTWRQWEELYDTEHQLPYYFNNSDGTSSWTKPVGWPY